MDEPIVVTPDALRQYDGPAGAFFLVTDAELTAMFAIGDSAYHRTRVLAIPNGAGVAEIVNEVPDEADVLVIAPRSFVQSTDLENSGGRRIAVMPCGSTPVAAEHIRYFLGVLERTDPFDQAARADKFFDAIAESGSLRLVDPYRRTECAFDPGDPDYVWNQQAGPLESGEHQIAPAGELSVLPMEITNFDATRRLALDGTLTLRGEPIVHGGYDPAIAGQQAELYNRLVALRRNPVVIQVDRGLITECRAGSPAPDGLRAADTLNALLELDSRYRTVWELGFGINTAMSVVAANCGMNEVFGGTDGVVHLGIGLTPFTGFALTFLCPDTTLTDAAGAVLLGSTADRPAEGSRRRLRRTRDASCGCH
jgi:hypothetical protein